MADQIPQPRRELVQVMADQLLRDQHRDDLSEDDMDLRLMSAAMAALTREERAMGQMARRLYLHAAALGAIKQAWSRAGLPPIEQ